GCGTPHPQRGGLRRGRDLRSAAHGTQLRQGVPRGAAADERDAGAAGGARFSASPCPAGRGAPRRCGNMRLLALDTATESCSAALALEDRLLTREAELARGHAERILPMIDELLAEAGIGLQALDAIAFGRGPGSFTGLRLAAGIAQGLDGLAREHGPERVGPPAGVQLPPAWSDAAGLGRGFAAYRALRVLAGVTVPEGWDRLLPRAAEVARLAGPELAAGRLLAPEAALPVYLRDDVARPPP